VLPPEHPHHPFPEYHSSHDNVDRCSFGRLKESVEVVLSMVDALEANVVPRNLFKGEPFCSRYGLHIDAYENPEGNKALFDILFEIDGKKTVADIATTCGVSFQSALQVLLQLKRLRLVTLEG